MKKIVIVLAILGVLLAGCGKKDDEKKPTETSTSTAPPVQRTVTPTNTSTVTVPPGTETETSVEQPTDTVTAPGPTETVTTTAP